VQHAVAPCDGASHEALVAHVPFEELDVGEAMGEVLAPPGTEVVEHAHFVAPREQRVDEMRADEPGASGDKDET